MDRGTLHRPMDRNSLSVVTQSGESDHRCPKGDIVTTRLDAFLRANKKRMPARVLAAESEVSRQHIYRLRYGLMEPTRALMVRLLDGSSRLLGRTIRMVELFDLGDGE